MIRTVRLWLRVRRYVPCSLEGTHSVMTKPRFSPSICCQVNCQFTFHYLDYSVEVAWTNDNCPVTQWSIGQSTEAQAYRTKTKGYCY